MVWFFSHKTIDDVFTEEDLKKAGFVSAGVGFGHLDIYAKDNHRVLYDPVHDRVHSAYNIHRPSKKLSIDQVNEILQAVEHLRHEQHNLGSD